MAPSQSLLNDIKDEFADVDLSFIASVEYYRCWTDWECSGILLIFTDEIGDYWCAEGGSTPMAEDNTNVWNPCELTKEQANLEMANFDKYVEENNKSMESS